MAPLFYKSFFALSLTTLLAVSSCDKNNSNQHAGKDLALNASEMEIVGKSNQFALHLFHESLTNLPENENALVSPLSIQAALAMTWQGTKGQTHEAIAEAIGLHGVDTDLINSYFKKLINDLPALDPKTRLDIANSIWYRQGFDVIPAFLDVNRSFYQAEVHALDFDDPAAADRINQWVKTNTNNKIEKIVNQLDRDLVMLLVNAVYFKGSWAQEFEESDTYSDEFRYGAEHAQVTQARYMKADFTYPYISTSEFEAVELPYGDNKYSMLVIKPRDGVRPAELIQTLSNEAAWTTRLDTEAMTSRKMILSLPKFKFSYANKLNDELTNLGMGIAFTPAADMTGINAGGQLMISEVNHKTFIEVNEEGTEAAAVTSVGVVLTSAGPQPLQLKLDRPFLFAIREKSSGLIIFMGQMNNPNSESTKL